jgi:hypothetical protein
MAEFELLKWGKTFVSASVGRSKTDVILEQNDNLSGHPVRVVW